MSQRLPLFYHFSPSQKIYLMVNYFAKNGFINASLGGTIEDHNVLPTLTSVKTAAFIGLSRTIQVGHG